MPPKKVDLIVENAKFVLTMAPERRLLENASIAVHDKNIVAIGDAAEIKKSYNADRTINAKYFFVTPGFVNGHVHLESCYDKGMIDDVPVVAWCERYFSFTYGALTEENYYIAAMTTLIACLKSGTTTVSDCGTIQTMEDSPVRAVADLGMKAVLARDLMDIHSSTKSDYVSYDAFNDLVSRLQENTNQCIDRSEAFIKKYNGYADGRVRTALDLQQVCNCSPELCAGVKALSEKYDVGIQTHAGVSHDMVEMTRKRFGVRDIEYMDQQGVVGPKFLAAHMAWLNGREQAIMRDRQAHVAHVPGSSMHGVLSACSSRGRIPEMVSMGVNVTIGNDESSTGTCHDIVRDMYLVAVAHAEARHPMLFPDRELFMLGTGDQDATALEMGTLNGAKALGWEKEIGSLEVGKRADMAMYDLTQFPWIPTTKENLITNFIYNGTGQTCDTVVIDGKVVMEGRKILTIDERDILEQAQKYAEKIIPGAPWLKKPEVWELKWVRE